jgi:hypothetical protein
MTRTPSKRRRGAQPGNRNAIRHGLYARHYTDSQRRLLGDMPPLESLNEIHMLRIGLDGVLSLILTCEDQDRKIKLYNALFSGTQRLLSAMRTHAVLVGDNVELLSDFWNALALYQDEKGL